MTILCRTAMKNFCAELI